jgi:hypothetical protein
VVQFWLLLVLHDDKIIAEAASAQLETKEKKNDLSGRFTHGNRWQTTQWN